MVVVGMNYSHLGKIVKTLQRKEIHDSYRRGPS